MKLYITLFAIICIPFMLYLKDVKNEYETIIDEINNSEYKLWNFPIKPNVIFIDIKKNKMHLFHYYNNKIESTLETWDNKIMPANSAVNYNTNRYITINYNTYKKLSHANKKN